MNLERILAYVFIFLFVISIIGCALYSTVVIILSIIKNHKINKKIIDSMSETERRNYRFLKRVWK